MKKSGFTLIELLVVITIIAVLAGIALPVFQKAQEKARSTQDANNLKQIGVGLIGYMGDNDDILPDTAKRLVAELNDKLGGVNAAATGNTGPTVTNISSVFKSPFDNRDLSSNPVSYGFNSNIIDKDMGKANALSSLIAAAAAPVQDGKSTLTFTGTATTPVSWLTDLTPAAATPGGTHNSRRQINVVYGDGHIESLRWAKFSETTGTEGTRRWVPF